jgi:hypothetical protein
LSVGGNIPDNGHVWEVAGGIHWMLAVGMDLVNSHLVTSFTICSPVAAEYFKLILS